MAKLKIEGFKGSEVLRIEAVILGFAETVSEDVELDTDLMPGKVAETLQVTLRFISPELVTLNKLRDRLGNDFTPSLFGKGKSGIFFCIEGRKEAFKKLLEWTSQQTSQHSGYPPNRT